MMSTCNRLDMQTLGSQPVMMPKNLPDHCTLAQYSWTLFFIFYFCYPIAKKTYVVGMKSKCGKSTCIITRKKGGSANDEWWGFESRAIYIMITREVREKGARCTGIGGSLDFPKGKTLTLSHRVQGGVNATYDWFRLCIQVGRRCLCRPSYFDSCDPMCPQSCSQIIYIYI